MNHDFTTQPVNFNPPIPPLPVRDCGKFAPEMFDQLQAAREAGNDEVFVVAFGIVCPVPPPLQLPDPAKYQSRLEWRWALSALYLKHHEAWRGTLIGTLYNFGLTVEDTNRSGSVAVVRGKAVAISTAALWVHVDRVFDPLVMYQDALTNGFV